MFLWLLGVFTFCIIGIAVVTFLVKTAISKRNLSFYEQQGAQIYFDPILGQISLFSPKHKYNKDKPNSLELVKKLVNSWKGKKVIAANNFVGTKSTLLLYDSDLIKEFLLKEDQFEKTPFTKAGYDALGLFFQNGEKFNRSKGLFMKIFAYDGMEKLAPKICKIINSTFDEYNKAHKVTKSDFKRIDLNEMYAPIFQKIANFIIFGGDSYSDDSDEVTLSKLNHEFGLATAGLRRNLLFTFMPDLALKLGLVGSVNRMKVIQRQQEDLLFGIIEKRKRSPEHLGDCVIDRIIKHNLECEKTGNTADILNKTEIMGNYNLFHLAASDTSQNTTKTSICFQATHETIKKYVEEIAKEIYDSDGLTTTEIVDNNQKLTLWLKETLRVHNPAPRMNMRVALNDVSLGKFNVRKGDSVALLLTALLFDESVFPDFDNFKLDRFNKESEKELPRYQYIPFSVGKRVCLGRHLGELMVKLLVTQFVRSYDFTKPADIQYKQVTLVTNNMVNPIVLAKLK